MKTLTIAALSCLAVGAFLNALALAAMVATNDARLIGLGCSTGLIVLRDEEDEFGRCWKIEALGR